VVRLVHERLRSPATAYAPTLPCKQLSDRPAVHPMSAGSKTLSGRPGAPSAARALACAIKSA